MMNFTLKSAFLALFISISGNVNCNAQVGIGTTTPVGALDVTSTNEGFLIPRIALSATNVATVLTPTVSELVYNTFTSALGPNQVAPGYYYWNGSLWVPISTGNLSGWSLTGNTGTTAATNFIGTTDAIDFVTRTNNTEKTRLTSSGSLGIGTTSPVAKLDIAAGVTTVNSLVNATGSFNDFLQFNVQNTSTGTQAQSGYSATADNGTATTGFAWLGINNSAFNFPTAYNIGGANDVSYVGSGQDMHIANANNTKSIILSTGKATTPFFDERMRIINNGNVGIGTAAPAAKLDVAAAVTTTNSIVNATGSINDFLQFNVQNTSTGTQAQSGYSATANNGTATTGFAWIGINNSAFNFPTAYNIGGANDVSYIGSGQDMYVANANNTKSIIFSTGKAATPFFDERMRILNGGQVAVNNSTPAAGDLFTSTSSATNTYAINGYSANNGSGVYGSISSGTTIFGGVQGEYFGSVSSGTGTRGITHSTGAGTTLANSNSGVDGQLGNGTNVFSFGIKGECNTNTGNQVGGVIGISNGGTGYGMLGYKRSTAVIYAVLGNIAYQNSTFKSSQNSEVSSSSIGIGINGGFLGGHIKGNQYGLITKGSRFGSYTDGTTITNKAYAVVNESKTGEKIATYAATSTTIDLSTKGIGNLVNGTATIMFDKNFSSLISKGKPTIVTVSPMGETNGVYVSSVTENGFTIKENKGGSSTISFYWIAVGEKDIAKQAEVPAEVLAKDFDKNLEDVLNIDEDSKSIANAMWWNGRSLEFGKTPPAISNQNQTKANSKK